MSATVLRFIGGNGSGKSTALRAFAEERNASGVECLLVTGDSSICGIQQELSKGDYKAVLIDEAEAHWESQEEFIAGLLDSGLAHIVVASSRHPAEAQIDWLQKVNTLHRQVDILYVVDGYEVTITWDDNPVSEGFHGETVAEAISKAMAGFDLEKFTRVDGDIYGHERQMAALAAQRDELLSLVSEYADQHKTAPGYVEGGEFTPFPESSYLTRVKAAIAKAKGGAA